MPLISLDLSDTDVSQIPDNLFSNLTLLSDVNLSRTNIRRIPESIKFSELRELCIRDCKFLQSIQELPLTIGEANAWGCTSLEMVSNSMAALTQPPKDDVCLPVRFEFSNCIKLKHQNIMPEFQIRALLIATKFALQGDSTQKDESGGINICYPGEEIPKWFNFQTEGRSMNVRLPYNPKSLMSFAFCFICKQPECKEITHLECEINVKTIYGNEWKSRCDVVTGRFHHENRKSLHVLMTTFMSKEESFSLAREISFNIRGTQAEVKRNSVRRFGTPT
ncbi:hypothetical protein TIFTF001_024816 [Ficus carica]|uniref:C-JID domain-containing protein n=1 Tax=Ficus carica TaxID=3494 RepID=A0AA88AMP6_FICCA|nr:hypothetical protein TIFTF001_024816 [Ficus carica]